MKLDLRNDEDWTLTLNSYDRRRSAELIANSAPAIRDSGRRPRSITHTVVSVELTVEQVAALDRAKGAGSRADWLRSVLLPALERIP